MSYIRQSWSFERGTTTQLGLEPKETAIGKTAFDLNTDVVHSVHCGAEEDEVHDCLEYKAAYDEVLSKSLMVCNHSYIYSVSLRSHFGIKIATVSFARR